MKRGKKDKKESKKNKEKRGKGAGMLEKLPFPAKKRSVSNGLSGGRKSLKKAKAKISPGRKKKESAGREKR